MGQVTPRASKTSMLMVNKSEILRCSNPYEFVNLIFYIIINYSLIIIIIIIIDWLLARVQLTFSFS